MKKTSSGVRGKIVRHIITYLICLLLAVLTWLLVMYTESEENKPQGEGTQAVCVTDGSRVTPWSV